MLKMTIDNEEVLSNNDISIKEEILSPSSTILNNVYPKSWELDKDYTSRFYYPKDYSKLNIQNFSIEPEEAGKTIQVNGSATLTDVDTSKESRVLRLLGQTSQNGTPTPSSPIPINVVSGDNYIDICGKNLANVSSLSAQSTYLCPCKVGETYTISFKGMATSTDKRVFLRSYNGAFSTSLDSYVDAKVVAVTGSMANYTMTLTSTIDGFLYLRVAAGYTSYTLEDIQLEKGSTATTYEPYIGNSYPIYLGVLGKNLFDGIIESGGFDSNGLNVAMNSRLRSKDYVRVKPNTTYTVSTTNNDNSRTLQISISKYAVNDYTTPRISYVNWTNLPVTFTTDSNCNFIRLLYKYTNETTMQISNISNEQVELSDEATTYEKYNPLELCKIGTYQDYIYKENDSWYLHKEIGKVVLDGSETYNWFDAGITNVKGAGYTINEMISTNYGYGFSNYFYNPRSDRQAGTIRYGANNKDIYLYVNVNDFANVSAFKTWLSSHNTIVYYVLATPTNTEITDETLLEQLESLSS